MITHREKILAKMTKEQIEQVLQIEKMRREHLNQGDLKKFLKGELKEPMYNFTATISPGGELGKMAEILYDPHWQNVNKHGKDYKELHSVGTETV